MNRSTDSRQTLRFLALGLLLALASGLVVARPAGADDFERLRGRSGPRSPVVPPSGTPSIGPATDIVPIPGQPASPPGPRVPQGRDPSAEAPSPWTNTLGGLGYSRTANPAADWRTGFNWAWVFGWLRF